MNCDQTLSSLSAHLDNELSPSEGARVVEHLLACPACATEFDALKCASRLVRDLPLCPLPPGFITKINLRRAAASAPLASAFSSWLGPRSLAFVAATIVLGLVLAGPLRWRRLARAPGGPVLSDASADLPPLNMPAATGKAALSGGSADSGTPLGSSPSYTNELLHQALQKEGDELGLAPAVKEPERRSQPFMGETLGQPGTRQQAESAIRDLSRMRRSIEASAGNAAAVPIMGSIAPVLGQAPSAPAPGQAIEPGHPLSDGFWSGNYAASNEGTRTIEDTAAWAALWGTLSTSPAPFVDFKVSQVVAIFLGPRPSGGYSVEITEIKRTASALIVRYKEHAPEPGQSRSDGATSPYALKQLLRTDLPVRFEKKSYRIQP